MHNSYNKMKYTIAQRTFANVDKLSFNRRGSKRTYSPYGVFTLYSNSNGHRRFSISKSEYFHNGGSYTIGSIRNLLSGF